MSGSPARFPYVLGSFSIAGCKPFGGVVIDDRVISLEALNRFAAAGRRSAIATDVRGVLDAWPASIDALTDIVDSAVHEQYFDSVAVGIAELTLHTPFEPRTIYAAGANYRQHVIDIIVDRFGESDKTPEEKRAAATATIDERAKTGMPYFFIKSNGSLAGPCDDIILPPDARQPDWEVELALVIGRRARHVPREDAFSVIAGYAVANDVSDRAYMYRKDVGGLGADWLSSKSSPTYTPFGPFLVPAMSIDPHRLLIKLALNGELMQDADTSDMIFQIPRLIEYLSSRVELYPGDIVLTGSPQGNGTHYDRYLQPGDVIEATIPGLGTQRNRIVAESR